jgi:hypothetical protein
MHTHFYQILLCKNIAKHQENYHEFIENYLNFFLKFFLNKQGRKKHVLRCKQQEKTLKNEKRVTQGPGPVQGEKTGQLKAQGSLDRSNWIGSKIQRPNTCQHTSLHIKSWEGSQ